MFTAETALRLGYTRRQVRYRLNTGQWHRIAGRGLGIDPPPPSGWPALALARAACLTWPEVVVGFRVAAAVLGFPVSPGQEVHVLTAATRRPWHGVVPHQMPWQPDEVVTGPNGIRLTRTVRTAVDCLATLPKGESDALYAWLVTRQRLSPTQLGSAVRAGTLRPGNGRLRDLQRRTASGALSEAERRVHQLLRKADIGGWEANARVSDGEGLIGVVDLLFREARVVVEIDGRRVHEGEDRFVQDRRRQNRLVNAGYRVLRFTWADVMDRPGDLLFEINTALST